MGDAVSLEVVDRVAHVTIERPERRNAMNLEVFEQLAGHAATLAADTDVGAVVVAGRDGAFSSGLDLQVLGGQVATGIDAGFIARLQATFTAYEQLDVPTVAAITGPCLGAGLQLAAACHVRLVAPDASLSVLEVRCGLIPDLGGTWRLPRLIGLGRATDLVLTGRTVTADEAVTIGLAEVALPADDPLGAAHVYAARLASGPGAVRRTPRLLRDHLDVPRDVALAAEARVQLELLGGPDVAESVAAAREGRAPVYVGR